MFFFLSFPFLCSAIEKTSPNRKRSSFVFVASLPSVGINHIKFKGLAFHPLSCISTPSFLLYFLDYSIFFLNGKYFFSQLGKLRGKRLSLFTKISKKLKIILLYFFRKMTTLKKVQHDKLPNYRGRVRETVSVSRMESAEGALLTRGKLQVSKHLC